MSMRSVDEQTERLIVRKLDGELSLAEEHELNKVLIRSPEARALLDSYSEQDRLASGLVSEEVGSCAPPDLALVTAGAGSLSPRRHAKSWAASFAAGLMVACLALFAILLRPAMLPVQPNGADEARVAGSSSLGLPVGGGDRFEQLPKYFELPQTERQELDRQFIGVYDEKTGRVYILEVRRVSNSRRLVAEGI
ncbi:MAG: hypothetical protein JSU68_05925 [Phycisphaerales bacterium]|nr:MAG: hypothetical protein JSU68_05925 [Phycisphaerales bacterium]